jgi:hypothetical protein
VESKRFVKTDRLNIRFKCEKSTVSEKKRATLPHSQVEELQPILNRSKNMQFTLSENKPRKRRV